MEPKTIAITLVVVFVLFIAYRKWQAHKNKGGPDLGGPGTRPPSNQN